MGDLSGRLGGGLTCCQIAQVEKCPHPHQQTPWAGGQGKWGDGETGRWGSLFLGGGRGVVTLLRKTGEERGQFLGTGPGVQGRP